MQINIALCKNNREQADIIRKVYYPNTTANQTRDAFIFNQCIDGFKDDLDVLKVYLKKDEQLETVQRMLTIKSDSNERLKTIAASLNASIAATYRSIIAYSVDKIDKCEIEVKVDESYDSLKQQVLKEKISLLEVQLADCSKTITEIKSLLV